MIILLLFTMHPLFKLRALHLSSWHVLFLGWGVGRARRAAFANRCESFIDDMPSDIRQWKTRGRTIASTTAASISMQSNSHHRQNCYKLKEMTSKWKVTISKIVIHWVTRSASSRHKEIIISEIAGRRGNLVVSRASTELQCRSRMVRT